MKDKNYVKYCWDQNNYINVMVYAFKKTDENSMQPKKIVYKLMQENLVIVESPAKAKKIDAPL